MAKTLTLTIPDQVATDYTAKYGTAALALAYIKGLLIADYNKLKSDQADAAAIASRVAPTPITNSDLPGGSIA